MIGYVARYPHLRRHLQPILNELWNRGIEVREGPGDLTLCAARYDLEQIHSPVVLVEHGAGQTYLTNGVRVDAGSTGKPVRTYEQVVLYVGPNRELCDFYQTWLPNASTVVASPLVEWMRTVERNPVNVVFAVHWPSPLGHSIPEAGTSWPDSVHILKALKPDVVHCHPRIAYRMPRDLKHHLITAPFVEDWDQVWPHTRLLIVDNSSILWEAAAVGIDVAVIHPAHWVGHHGLRFGPEADPLVRVTESNAHEVKSMLLPKPAGSPYEHVESSASRVADAIQTLLT